MNRFTLMLVPGILAVTLFLGVDRVGQSMDPTVSDPQDPGVDFTGYSIGVSSVHYDELGNIQYTLAADRQISYANSQTDLEEPVIRLYQEGAEPWNIAARSGTILAAAQSPATLEEIVLTGDVKVHRTDKAGNRTVLSTESLTIDPTTDVLTSDLSVTMVDQRVRQTATGMRIHLDTEEMVFYRDVRGTYAIPEN